MERARLRLRALLYLPWRIRRPPTYTCVCVCVCVCLEAETASLALLALAYKDTPNFDHQGSLLEADEETLVWQVMRCMMP